MTSADILIVFQQKCIQNYKYITKKANTVIYIRQQVI